MQSKINHKIDLSAKSGHFRDFSALVDPWVVSKQVSTWYRL